ncbi:glycosyltransferase family 4 protein [Ectobacillus ponti]|uniref:Glycosyltransferase family 4 protein n=1 Tax=Ectobacillus ponti TaxID=2961894 RepID=A0AA42BP54_9BACI|nr:glycosyltransferase family 4 protein [Ectobacillus ponti]MCP8968051.1 glycosyltransferase family 4 protein [Ectobacillus ponti]
MKVLYVNAGAEEGGGKTHILSLLLQFPAKEVEMAVFEEGSIAREARESGMPVHLFAQTSRYDISVLPRLARFINERGFDIIHTHGARANFFLSLIKDRIHAKWVTTVHSDPLLDFMECGVRGWLFTRLHLRSFRKVDLFFAITEQFKENLLRLGVPAEKIRTVYNGIEYDQQPAAPYSRLNLGIEAGAFTLIQVARLHPVKRHEILFEALQKAGIPNVKVLLVGDGTAEQHLKQEVSKRGLSSVVSFLGYRKDVKRLYASADLSLLTSQSESFPLVLLESANQRVPFIATNVGDMHKLIPDPSYGWIVPIDDADALAEALCQAYSKWQRGELKEMGQRIHEYASRRFSLRKLYEDTHQAYRQLLQHAVRV